MEENWIFSIGNQIEMIQEYVTKYVGEEYYPVVAGSKLMMTRKIYFSSFYEDFGIYHLFKKL